MKKISIIIISLVVMITLVKCATDKLVEYNQTPKINPNPIQKVRIHGKFPFDKNMTLRFDTTYINDNPKCDQVFRAFGVEANRIKKTIYQEGIPAIINKDGTYEAIIYLDSYLPGFCVYKPLFADFNFYYKYKDDGGGRVIIRFVDKKIDKHSIEIHCELLKNKYEKAKQSNEHGYICELEKNQYFIDYSKAIHSLNLNTQNYLEVRALPGDFNELSINQKDIEINFKYEGEK